MLREMENLGATICPYKNTNIQFKMLKNEKVNRK